MSDPIGPIFAALSDPTRRSMVEMLLNGGTTTVPVLTQTLPITRQAVAKHLSALTDAGLVERAPGEGREIQYRLSEHGLDPATAWLRTTEMAWNARLTRLKRSLEP